MTRRLNWGLNGIIPEFAAVLKMRKLGQAQLGISKNQKLEEVLEQWKVKQEAAHAYSVKEVEVVVD